MASFFIFLWFCGFCCYLQPIPSYISLLLHVSLELQPLCNDWINKWTLGVIRLRLPEIYDISGSSTLAYSWFYFTSNKKLSCFKRLRQVLVSLNLIAWYLMRWKNKRKKTWAPNNTPPSYPCFWSNLDLNINTLQQLEMQWDVAAKEQVKTVTHSSFYFPSLEFCSTWMGEKKSIEKFQLGVSATAALRSISPCTPAPALHCRR